MYDEDVIVPQQIEVQQASISSATAPTSKPSRRSGSISFPVRVAYKAISKLDWRNALVGGAFATSFVFYMGQWQKPAPPTVQENPLDVRNIPAYSEAPLMQQDLANLQQQDLNFAALMSDERQREIIAIAQIFVAQATRFSGLPGHKCNGITPVDCLNTFDENRLTELNNLALQANQKNTDPLKPILTRSEARLKVEGLKLAKILMTPPGSRRPTEQQVLDTQYPALASGLPNNQLQPRPALVAKNLRYQQSLEQELASKNPEQQSVVEGCLSIPEDQRKNIIGCNR